MPTDSAVQSVEVDAPVERVLATVRDVESQVAWIPEIVEAELLEVYEEDGLPATARFKATAAVGTDQYTLSYEHSDAGMSWTLVEGRLQTGQEGGFVLERLPGKRTRVTYALTIRHNLPLPGFVRSRVIRGLVAGTVSGLKAYLER